MLHGSLVPHFRFGSVCFLLVYDVATEAYKNLPLVAMVFWGGQRVFFQGIKGGKMTANSGVTQGGHILL